MGYDGAMRSRFILGLALTAAALVAALAEIAARRLADDAPLLLSAYDLWSMLRPGSLIAAEAHVGRLLPWLWDPAIVTILAFPVWLLLGPPGLLLIWRYSPRRGTSDIDEDALFLYDRLAERARAEGYGDSTADLYVLPTRRDVTDDDGDGPASLAWDGSETPASGDKKAASP